MSEVWKAIPGYPNYEVSDLGNVRNVSTNYQLKPYPARGGYLMVKLYNGNIKQTYAVANLVAQAFLPPCPGIHTNENDGYTIDHINEVNTDNKAINLRWLTGRANVQRRDDSKLTEDDVREIRALKEDHTATELAEKFNTSRANIKTIWQNRTWTNVV